MYRGNGVHKCFSFLVCRTIFGSGASIALSVLRVLVKIYFIASFFAPVSFILPSRIRTDTVIGDSLDLMGEEVVELDNIHSVNVGDKKATAVRWPVV